MQLFPQLWKQHIIRVGRIFRGLREVVFANLPLKYRHPMQIHTFRLKGIRQKRTKVQRALSRWK